jgi:AcrR family transcriptional regulator
MTNDTFIRKPKQKRSIEKKDKIIKAGLELFSKKGYHNTNTIEIAKSAGVSTGTVYSYFKDKKSIYIDAFEYFLNQNALPVIEKIADLPKQLNDTLLVEKIIDAFLEFYQGTSSAMKELTTTMSIDEDICKYFCEYESRYFLKFSQAFKKHGVASSNMLEKFYLSYTLLDLLGLEKTNYHHNDIHFDTLKKEAAKAIIYILSGK